MTELCIARLENLKDELNDTPDRPATFGHLALTLEYIISALDQVKEALDG